MNANSQALRGCVGRDGGIPNYKNVKNGSPVASIEFNNGGGDKASEEAEQVATAKLL